VPEWDIPDIFEHRARVFARERHALEPRAVRIGQDAQQLTRVRVDVQRAAAARASGSELSPRALDQITDPGARIKRKRRQHWRSILERRQHAPRHALERRRLYCTCGVVRVLPLASFTWPSRTRLRSSFAADRRMRAFSTSESAGLFDELLADLSVGSFFDCIAVFSLG
jgi:hypothetical protein